MGYIYSSAKRVYYGIRKVPVLGALAMHLAPVAQKTVRKLDTWEKPHTNGLKHAEILSQAIISLQSSVKDSLQQMRVELADCRTQLQEQAVDYQAQINGYRDRLEFVRLEILEQCSSTMKGKRGEKSDTKPKILNQEKYQSALATNNVLLNIGCGHKPIAGRLNVDKRSLPGVDIVADATDLPFEPGVVSEIYVAHLVEHFTLSALKNTVFPYWLDLLAARGVLKIIVPDMPSMIAAFVQGDMTFSDLAEVTFGKQDYDDDFHYAMFSPGTLRGVLISSGFKYVDIVDENRENGKCREMEVWARKF